MPSNLRCVRISSAQRFSSLNFLFFIIDCPKPLDLSVIISIEETAEEDGILLAELKVSCGHGQVKLGVCGVKVTPGGVLIAGVGLEG